MAKHAVRSKAMVLLLLIHYLLLLPLFVGVLCLVHVLLYSTLCPSSVAIILMGKRKRASCFTLTVFLMACDSQCSVALSHGAVGWSVVCDCGSS